MKKNEILHFDFLQLLHFNSILVPWKDNICDCHLQTTWDISYSGSTTRIVYKVMSARKLGHTIVSRPHRNTPLLTQSLAFECYMARHVVNNEHQKDAWYDESGLCAQNKDTIISSAINTIDHVYVTVLKNSIVLTSIAYNFCISTPILALLATMSKKPNGERLNEHERCEIISISQPPSQTLELQNLRQMTIQDMFN